MMHYFIFVLYILKDLYLGVLSLDLEYEVNRFFSLPLKMSLLLQSADAHFGLLGEIPDPSSPERGLRR